MAARKYRTKLGVLRDVLVASRHGSKKTRIIGLANLNRTSFESYVSFCLKNDLLVQRDGHYETTPRAEEALGVIEVVLTRASELDAALKRLSALVSYQEPNPGDSNRDGPPFSRYFSDRLLSTLDTIEPHPPSRSPRTTTGRRSR